MRVQEEGVGAHCAVSAYFRSSSEQLTTPSVYELLQSLSESPGP